MENKPKKSNLIIKRWPIVLVALGILLSIAWLVLLIWFPLHLFSLV